MPDTLSDLSLHFRKDETSGTVMRNEVRTLVLEDDFDSGSTSGTYGDVPTGWAEYALNIGGGDAAALSLSDGILTMSCASVTADVTRCGLIQSGAISNGVNHVGAVRVKINSAVGATPLLKVGAGFGSGINLSDYATGVWLDLAELKLSISTDAYIYLEMSIGESAEIEIEYVRIYQENAGDYVNSPTLGQPGQVGRAVAYSSGTDHATIPDHPAIHLGEGLADFSISLWLKTSSSSFQHIVSNYAGVDSSFELLMHTSGTPYFIGRDAGGIWQWNPTSSLATPFNDGDWHNILLTFEFGGTAGATVRYYLDGALDYSAALPSWTPTYASALGYIAQRYDGVNPYVGLIDDMRFYGRLLDAGDAKLLRRRGFPHGRYSVVQPIVASPIVSVLG